MQDPPRGFVTFLFTDIEGSARLGMRHPHEIDAVKARHHAILTAAAAAHGGFVYDRSGGDAAKIAFELPRDAILTAIDAQIALNREPWPTQEPLWVRMALHICHVDPVRDEQGWDYRSSRLDRLGRLVDATYGGQILITSTLEGHVREELPEGVSLRDLGLRRMRDLQPEHICQIVHPDLPSEFPPFKDSAASANNLPNLPTSLIGRGREAEEVRGLLLESDVRLLTLTGAGGTGKTRLAILVAAGLLGEFPDGVFLVDLSALVDPQLVPSAIARTLGVREEPERPVIQSLVEWLGDRRLLLVLDTFEQVVGAANVVADLLRACPRLEVLIASRVPLSIQGEVTYSVPPLAVPDPHGPPEAIITSESVQLFLERARNVQPALKATAAIAPSLAKICARLDGLPLAIELAAARIKIFPPQTLAERLEHRLSLLTGGARDLPSRQRTLRATIAWSYDLLPPPEQDFFRRLSVFAGGFSFEAAEALIAGGQGDRGTGGRLSPQSSVLSPLSVPLSVSVLDGLQVLIDHSLLRQEDRDGEPRYSMLDTIREYAAEGLESSGELSGIRDDHAAIYLEFAERTEPRLRGAEREQSLASLDTERDNLRAALGSLRNRADAERGLRLASALWQWWWWRTSLVEGRRWLEEMLALSGAADHPVQRARALTGLATLVETQGDHATSEALFTEAESLWKDIGDLRGLATSFLFRWLVAFDHEDYPRMNKLAQMSREMFEKEVGDPWGIALSEAELGIGAMREAQFETGAMRAAKLDEAEALLTTSRMRFERIPDRWGIAIASGTLGNVAFGRALSAMETGDHATAKLHYELGMTRLMAALETFLQAGDGWGLATFMLAPARAASDLRQWDCATRLMGAAAAYSDAIGAPVRLPFREVLESNIKKAKAELGPEAFETFWEEGQAMSPDKAIKHAFEVMGHQD